MNLDQLTINQLEKLLICINLRDDSSCLLPRGVKWWRLATMDAKINDRIEVGITQPTRKPLKIGGEIVSGKEIPWIQWSSAAITFSGVAESDSSGLATDTHKRNPLTYGDCKILADNIPGAVFKKIKLPHADAAVVYLPKFFNSGEVNQAAMVEEMTRIKPQYIDRYMQNRGPTKTMHKNKRWNTNITDRRRSNPDDIYIRDMKRSEEVKKKKDNGETVYIPKLKSSEVPFAELPAFAAAREKIQSLGKFLPDEEREPFGNQRNNFDQLVCELNFYYNTRPLPPGGIGFHGDVERNLVFGGSIGTEDRFIEWVKYHKGYPVKENGKIDVYRIRLEPGDGYIMSDFAAGNNWKNSSITTIRHRAGSRKFLYNLGDSKVKINYNTRIHTKDFYTDKDNEYFNTIDINPSPSR